MTILRMIIARLIKTLKTITKTSETVLRRKKFLMSPFLSTMKIYQVISR